MTDDHVARLTAINAIQELKHRYAAACDDDYDPDRISNMFTEDGVWSGGARWGVHRGRTAIHEYFAGTPAEYPWSIHHMTNQRITVADDLRSAEGSWYLWMAATLREDTELPVLVSGAYQDKFVKDEDEWRFEELKFESYFVSPLTTGWVSEPDIQVSRGQLS